MFAILSAMAGFAAPVLTELVGMLKSKQVHSQQMEEMRQRAELGLKQAEAERDKAEAESAASIYTSAQETARIELGAAKDSWVAAYSATVRPNVTYFFFFLYAYVKICTYYIARGTLPPQPAALAVA